MDKNYIKKIYRFIIPTAIRRIIFILRTILFNSERIFIVKNNTYNEDGLATNHIVDFLKDENFIRGYSESIKDDVMQGHLVQIRYRAYIINYFSNYALMKFKENKSELGGGGDFVELGTGRGIMAKVIMSNTSLKHRNNSKFYLFDTFKGIPVSSAKNNQELENIKYLNKTLFNGDYFESTKSKFSMYPNVELVKGELPGTLNEKLHQINKIIFLHIDLNNVYSEIESFKLIYDKLAIGSVIILDDYCYDELFREQKDGWDNFIKTKNNTILSLPTGQGFFIKI